MSQHTIATSATTTRTAARRPGRAANVALWTGQVVVAISFLFASYAKVTLDPMAVQGFAAIGISPTGTFVIGCLEIAGAIGMLVWRLTGLAALCSVALMIGAVAFTVPNMGVAMAALPAAIGVVAALVARGRWYSTVELAHQVRSVVSR